MHTTLDFDYLSSSSVYKSFLNSYSDLISKLFKVYPSLPLHFKLMLNPSKINKYRSYLKSFNIKIALPQAQILF